MAAAHLCQIKRRTQSVGESLQEFATAIQQLAHPAYPALPEDLIMWGANRVFADGVEDPTI
jgi:hypothetical protein